jgi:small-conductance mechanosensitive channel
MISNVGIQLLYGLLIILIAFGVQRLTVRGMKLVRRRHWLPPSASVLLGNFLRWAIWICAILFLLELFGLPIRALWAGVLSIALLVAIAFVASWSVLANILSAVLLLTFSRARIGDIVELRDTKQEEIGMRGKIIDINLFFVSLQELKPDLAVSENPPITQVPCHMFFFRVTRCWRGEYTQPLKYAFKEEKVVVAPEQTPNSGPQA